MVLEVDCHKIIAYTTCSSFIEHLLLLVTVGISPSTFSTMRFTSSRLRLLDKPLIVPYSQKKNSVPDYIEGMIAFTTPVNTSSMQHGTGSWAWQMVQSDIASDLHTNLTLKDSLLKLDTLFTPHGWENVIWKHPLKLFPTTSKTNVC
jgi:hypothetical protein